MEPLDHAICRLIESSARANQLPVGFLTRLIWRESSFRAAVISPAGAEGIAQFMPGTRRERGLADPFDPERAIPKAASLLADLRRQFGNLGVAAAAYNAGPGRVLSWLHGQGELPAETRAYVRFISGRDVADWDGLRQQRPTGGGAEPAEAQILRRVGRRSAPGSRRGSRLRAAGALGGPACRQFLEGAGARRLRARAASAMPGLSARRAR